MHIACSAVAHAHAEKTPVGHQWALYVNEAKNANKDSLMHG